MPWRWNRWPECCDNASNDTLRTCAAARVGRCKRLHVKHGALTSISWQNEDMCHLSRRSRCWGFHAPRKATRCVPTRSEVPQPWPISDVLQHPFGFHYILHSRPVYGPYSGVANGVGPRHPNRFETSPESIIRCQRWSSGEAATALGKLLATTFMWSGHKYGTPPIGTRSFKTQPISAAERPSKEIVPNRLI